MAKKTKPVAPQFETAALSLSEQVDHSLANRSHLFYGAVFNALDDYLKKNDAAGLDTRDFSTKHHAEDNVFTFTVKPHWQEDSTSPDPDEPIRNFFNKIYDIVSHQEIESALSVVNFDQTTGRPEEYVMTISDPSELMMILEKLLKPYDFGHGSLPLFTHPKVTPNSPLSFTMFAQYSLEHLRVMLQNMQGRGFEGHGLQLNH